MKKILLADDEKPYLLAIEDMLKSEGFEVIAEENGNNIITKVESEMPDCVVIDATISGVSGFDISRSLKEHSLYNKIPVILMIPKNGDYNLTQAITSMGNDSIQKPITRVELVAKINKQISIAEENEKNKNLKEKYFQLLECVGRSVVILDKKLNILGTNSEFMNLVGIKSDVHGLNLKKIYPEGYSVINELVDKGKGKIKLKNAEMALSPMGEDYILFIDIHDKEKEAIERVLIEFNFWSKLYKSPDIDTLTDNFISIIEKFIPIGEIYIARVFRGKVYFTGLDNPHKILYSIEAENTSINKINNEGVGFAGDITQNTFKDWNFLYENGYRSALLHPITLMNRRRVICFVHKRLGVYSSPVKDFSLLVQEFFLLYMYILQSRENKKSRVDIDDSYLRNIFEKIPLAFTYVKDRELVFVNDQARSLFGENNFKEILEQTGVDNKKTEEVIFLIYNAKQDTSCFWQNSAGETFRINFYPCGKADVLTTYENISETEKLKKLVSFKNRLHSIVSINEDIDTVFKELLGLIKKQLPCDNVAFLIYNDNPGVLSVKHTDMSVDFYKKSMPLNLQGSIFEKLMITKETIINNDLENKTISNNDEKLRQAGFLSYMSIPLIIKDKLYGAIELFSKNKNVFTHEYEKLMQDTALYASRSVMDNLVMHYLEDSAKKFDIITNLSKEVFLTVSKQGYIIDSNGSIFNILGYTPDEIKQKHLNDIMSSSSKWENALINQGSYDFANKKGGIKAISVSPAEISNDKYLLILHNN